MNEKNIRIKLSKIHKAFVDSIKDPDVKELVKKNSMISGGAITSMLLKEPINDIDYYFTNKETALAVAIYYVNEFINSKQNIRITPQVYQEDERIRIKIKSSGIVGQETDDSKYQYFETLAPESIEGEEYTQDSVGKEIEEADKLKADSLEKKSEELFKPVYLTDNAITLSGKIQLVIRFYGDPKEIHKNFDYIHCTNYWLSSNGKLYLQKEALQNTLEKELVYIGSKYPLCSIIRLRKFLKKGWYINAGQILKICFQISELDLKDVKVLEDQLTGVDTTYFRELIEAVKKDKDNIIDFQINMPYICSLVDKIF